MNKFLYLAGILMIGMVLNCKAEQKTNAMPRLLELGSKQCIPCKQMVPVLDKLNRDFAGKLNVEFIDVWKKENVEKARHYKINLIPTQIFFGSDGKELWRHEGFFSFEDIVAKWQSLGYDFTAGSKKSK